MAKHPPKTKYRATFSDGAVVKRSSYRTYTHAWRAAGSYISGTTPRTWATDGFSGSKRLADAVIAQYGGRATFAEVVAVEVL